MPIHGYAGGVISATPVTPTSTSASGVWTTELQAQALAAGNWPNASSQIARSLRFNSADTTYLNRTPASAGNRQIWTWSGWVKRSTISANYEILFSGVNSAGRDYICFNNAYQLNIDLNNATDAIIATTAVFRDPSAWYHIVVAVDTTQATSSNRIKLYVNGVQQTNFASSTYPSQNYNCGINNNVVHTIGQAASGTAFSFNGYMADIYFIDGQALTPSSFGFTDPNTGVWVPNAYNGSYGTNGFHLNFYNNTGTTSTTLGLDTSGNGNNWTPNNFSVTAGAGNDSLVDTPTPYGVDTGAGGEVRGNYCTLNPIVQNAFWASPNRSTLTNGNLDASGSPSAAFSTFEVPTNQKIYFETTCGTIGSLAAVLIAAANRNTFELNYLNNGQKQLTGAVTSSYGASWTTNDVIGVAIDRANNTATFYKNGVSQGAITHTFPSETVLVGAYMETTGVGFSFNFGQRPFAYTAPSGFKALCTTNLPTPAIGATSATRADDYFNPVLYTGNGSTQSVTGVGFAPDLVWIKSRSTADNHWLFDRLRGVTNALFSNTTSAENNYNNSLTAFGSDGFTTGSEGGTNGSGQSMVAWNWKANGAGSSNTQGTITSTVSANTTSGFSIVTYSNVSVSAQTIGHGLGVAPDFIICKGRTTTFGWPVYHKSLGKDAYLLLNATDAQNTGSANYWGTSVNSTTFGTLGNGYWNGQANMVAYCFAAVPGYSAFGSYTGNGSADGPFIYTGFRPAYVLIKVINNSGQIWVVADSKTNTSNVVDKYLSPNGSVAEGTYAFVDYVSNGFKLRNTADSVNGSGYSYMYAAFAEYPFKYANAR